MKKFILSSLVALSVFIFPQTVRAYDIDGSVLDWGIDLSMAVNAGYLNSHLPSGGWDIDVKYEDNADASKEWTHVGPGWSYYNTFDAEAMYFDNDQNYAYIAIVTGLPQAGINPPGNSYGPEGNAHVFKPGDIAFNVDGDSFYEYGLKISDGKLYGVSAWKNAVYDWGSPYDYNPWIIDTTSDAGQTINFAYSAAAINNHYVLEAAIPLSYLGYGAGPGDTVRNIGIHWSMECGNDYLNLTADVNPVPEPTTLAMLGIGLGLLGIRKRKFIS